MKPDCKSGRSLSNSTAMISPGRLTKVRPTKRRFRHWAPARSATSASWKVPRQKIKTQSKLGSGGAYKHAIRVAQFHLEPCSGVADIEYDQGDVVLRALVAGPEFNA